MSLLFINKTLRLNNLKTKTAKNAKISVFAICVEAIKYLLLYNLHDCTFKSFLRLPKNERKKLEAWILKNGYAYRTAVKERKAR